MDVLKAFQEGQDAWIDLRLGEISAGGEDDLQSVSSIDCSSIWSDEYDYRNDTISRTSSEEEDDDDDEESFLPHQILMKNFALDAAAAEEDDDEMPAPMSHNESYTSLRSRWNDTLDGSSDPVLINEQWSVKAITSPVRSHVGIVQKTLRNAGGGTATTTRQEGTDNSPKSPRRVLTNQTASAVVAAPATVCPLMDVSPEQPSRQRTASTLTLLSLCESERETDELLLPTGEDLKEDEVVGGMGDQGQGHRLLLVKKDSCPSLVTRTVSSKVNNDPKCRRQRRHSDGGLAVAECLTTQQASEKVDSCSMLVLSRRRSDAAAAAATRISDIMITPTTTCSFGCKQSIEEPKHFPQVAIVDNRRRRRRRHSDISNKVVVGSSCLTKAKKVDACPTLVRPRPSRTSDVTFATASTISTRNEQQWHDPQRDQSSRLHRRPRRYSDTTNKSIINAAGSCLELTTTTTTRAKKVDSCPTLVFPKRSNHYDTDNNDRWNHYINDDSFFLETSGRLTGGLPPPLKKMDYCPFLVQRTKSGIDESQRQRHTLSQSRDRQSSSTNDIEEVDSCPTLVRPRRSGADNVNPAAPVAAEQPLEQRQRRPPRRYGGRRNADSSRRSTTTPLPALVGLIPPLIRCNTYHTNNSNNRQSRLQDFGIVDPPLLRSKTDTCPSFVRRSISGDSSCDLSKLSPTRKDFHLTKTVLETLDFTTPTDTTKNPPQSSMKTTQRKRGRRRIKSNPEILFSESDDDTGVRVAHQAGPERYLMASERLGEIIRSRRRNDKSRSSHMVTPNLGTEAARATRGGDTKQESKTWETERKNLFQSFTDDTYSILRGQHSVLLSPNGNAVSNTAA